MTIDNKEFQEYIQAREERKKHLDKMNAKYHDVKMTFGKYKGEKVYNLATIQDSYFRCPGKQHLTWVSNNVEVENELLNEAIEFYKDYHYPHGDGYD